MVILTGWRYVAFVGTIVGVTGAAIYPIIIQPLIDPTYYRKLIHSRSYFVMITHSRSSENIQKKTRAGLKQEDIQPGSKFVFIK